MPVCTFCCKLRCLLSIVLMVAGLFLLSSQTAEAEETASTSTAQASVQTASGASAGEQAVASIKNNSAGSVNSGYLMQLVGGLLVVLVSIVVLAWFAKRFNRLQTSSDGSLQIIGGISMGARERVVLVRAGDEQILLGVSPGRINALHVLNEKADANDAVVVNQTTATGSHSFADKLQSVVEKTCNAAAGKDAHGRRILRAGVK